MDFQKSIINDRFELIKKIGEGGMSQVWRAEDCEKNNQVAIKFLKKEYISNRVEDRIRFRKEAAIIINLRHNHIVDCLEVGEHEGLDYIVLELLKGGCLTDFQKKNQPIKIDLMS